MLAGALAAAGTWPALALSRSPDTATVFTGSLEAGKLADFVILEKDPRRVDPEHIKDIAVLETWMDGKQVFRA